MSHRTDAQQTLTFRPTERNPARMCLDPAHTPPTGAEWRERRRRAWDAIMGIDPTEMHHS